MEERKSSISRKYVKPVLYYDDLNPASRSVLMLLKLLDVDIELRLVNLIKGEHLGEAYKEINPACIVPTLVHQDIILTGHSILLYVCENFSKGYAKQLLATDCYKKQLRILNRLFFEARILHRVHRNLMTALVLKTISGVDVEYQRRRVEAVYDTLESYLQKNDFMAGHLITLADIAMISSVAALDMMFALEDNLERWGKLHYWFRRMRAMPAYNIIYNGIEKQREIVEHYAQFSFPSTIKRLSRSVRPTYIPRLTLNPGERCSVEEGPLKLLMDKAEATHRAEESSMVKENDDRSMSRKLRNDYVKTSEKSEETESKYDNNDHRKQLHLEKDHSNKSEQSFKVKEGRVKYNKSLDSDLPKSPEARHHSEQPARTLNDDRSKSRKLRYDDVKASKKSLKKERAIYNNNSDIRTRRHHKKDYKSDSDLSGSSNESEGDEKEFSQSSSESRSSTSDETLTYNKKKRKNVPKLGHGLKWYPSRIIQILDQTFKDETTWTEF